MYKLNVLAVIFLMFALYSSAATARSLKQAKVQRGDEPLRARAPGYSPGPYEKRGDQPLRARAPGVSPGPYEKR